MSAELEDEANSIISSMYGKIPSSDLHEKAMDDGDGPFEEVVNVKK